jgi:hypothetical protein
MRERNLAPSGFSSGPPNLAYAFSHYGPKCIRLGVVLAVTQTALTYAGLLSILTATLAGTVLLASYCCRELIRTQFTLEHHAALGARQYIAGALAIILLLYFTSSLIVAASEVDPTPTLKFVVNFFFIFNGLACLATLVVGVIGISLWGSLAELRRSLQ